MAAPVLLLFVCSPSVSGKELRIEKFDAQIAVLPDSTVNVTSPSLFTLLAARGMACIAKFLSST